MNGAARRKLYGIIMYEPDKAFKGFTYFILFFSEQVLSYLYAWKYLPLWGSARNKLDNLGY